MLTAENGKYYLDGKEFKIISGSIHYFRVMPEYWRDRLLKLKAAGFNTVETYVCWNMHEKQKGVFDFSGILNLEEFLKLAGELGLYAIVRPSPYICAEWDLGGLPAWLLKDRNMRLRQTDSTYLRHVQEYYNELLPRLVPLQITHGGNILMMQIENEYGSYGSDKAYLTALADMLKNGGIDVPLFTSDGPTFSMLTGGTLPGVLKTVNFGSRTVEAYETLKAFDPDSPLFCCEFWCGWFDHWGETHHARDAEEVKKEITDMLNLGAGFNVYMFHGGTNFGFSAGANCFGTYEPTVTSYDDDALVNEWGGYTPKYHAVRQAVLEYTNAPETELPPEPRLQSIGRVELTESASLMENISLLGTPVHSVAPLTFEDLDQFSGFVLYRTVLKGDYEAGILYLLGLCDRAHIFVDRKHIATRYRNDADNSVPLPFLKKGTVIEILVEAMGRVNYGPELYDRKGIRHGVCIGNQFLHDWEMIPVNTELLPALPFGKTAQTDTPVLLKGEFSAETDKDCFVHMDGFKKGIVLVNGFNLGRYWEVGPQKSLYIPAPILKAQNEIVILELDGFDTPAVTIDDTPDIG